MKKIILQDGNKKYSYSDLIKMYGSEETVLINIYNWEKNKIIELNENNIYDRIK